MKKISFILPVFNEQGIVSAFHDALAAAVSAVPNYESEFIYVDDGSEDRSASLVLGLQKKDRRIRLVQLSRNFGHQMAITAGLDHASGDAAIVMDTDLQDPPALIPELIAEWEKGSDVVYATRRSRGDGLFKRVTARAFYRLLDALSDVKIPRDTGDFRLLDGRVVKELRAFREHARFMRGLSSYVGFRQTRVFFDRADRQSGETKYPLGKMIKLSMDALVGFSTVPLQFIGNFGFAVSCLSFIGILYALVVRVFFPASAVSGWAFIIIAVLFIGGVQMIMLGVLGSYIGRIYDEVRGRPLYIVSHIHEAE